MTGWKRRSRAPSFSMYLRYSSSVVAPIVWISPRESAGLSMFEASIAPSAAPAPMSVWSSSRKSTTFSDWRISFMTAFSRSSNWPRYFVPGDEGAEVELEQPLVHEHVGHVVADDLLREPLDDRRLAHARLADQHRVVLGAAGQDLDDALDLLLAADDRIELALAGQLGQVARELVEDRRLRALLGPRIVLVAEQRQRLLAHLVEPGAERLEDLRGDRLAFLHQAEQQMLGADVVVAELPRFLDGKLENALGLRRERHFTERERLRESGERALDLRLHRLEPEPEPLQNRRRDAFAVADQAEEDVLGPDEIVAETTSFLTRQDDDPSRPFGESFKHWFSPPLPQVAGCEFFLRRRLVTGLRPQYSPPSEGR